MIPAARSKLWYGDLLAMPADGMRRVGGRQSTTRTLEYVALDLDRVVDALHHLQPVRRFAAIVAGREDA